MAAGVVVPVPLRRRLSVSAPQDHKGALIRVPTGAPDPTTTTTRSTPTTWCDAEGRCVQGMFCPPQLLAPTSAPWQHSLTVLPPHAYAAGPSLLAQEGQEYDVPTRK